MKINCIIETGVPRKHSPTIIISAYFSRVNQHQIGLTQISASASR